MRTAKRPSGTRKGEGSPLTSRVARTRAEDPRGIGWRGCRCFIGCPTCDNESGRRQTDLCGLGKKATLPEYARSVNRKATRFSEYDIYQCVLSVLRTPAR